MNFTKDSILSTIAEVEKEFPELPPGALRAIATRETLRASAKDINALARGEKKGSSGEVGIFQFMPDTYEELGVDPLNVASSARGAARYLLQHKERFGSWNGAYMAYNWGPGNMEKWREGKRQLNPAVEDYAKFVKEKQAEFSGGKVESSMAGEIPTSPVAMANTQPLFGRAFEQDFTKTPSIPELPKLPELPNPDAQDIQAFPIDTPAGIQAVVPESPKETQMLKALKPTEQGLAMKLPELMSISKMISSNKPLFPAAGADAIDKVLLSIVRGV